MVGIRQSKGKVAGTGTDDLVERICQVVGPRSVILDPRDMEPYLTDWRKLYVGRARAVIRPATAAEVSVVVALCAAARVAIVPQGGNTGMVGASVPDESGQQIVIALERMNRIRNVDALDNTITVEAGCILRNVQEAASAQGRLFPLSLGAEGRCQIGGNLSTNAGGHAVLRYGNARDLVLGIEVVLPDGRIWNGLRALRKDNTGYDLKQLFIGAEGTLGIITAAVLKLFPQPEEIVSAFVGLSRLEDCMALLSRLRSAVGEAVTTFELIPRIGFDLAQRHLPDVADPLAERHAHYLLIEVAGSRREGGMRGVVEATLAEALDAGLVSDATLAANSAQAKAFWRIRDGLVEGQALEGATIKHDVSVPTSRTPDFIRSATAEVEAALPGVRTVAFGHLGDGNIHFNLTQPADSDPEAFLAHKAELNRVVHDIVSEMGGSISAEHGLGQLKREEISRYKSPLELELMRRVKAMLDPLNIMNPGKVL
jgi:D-lactate dehydrogenase (cytochrome)